MHKTQLTRGKISVPFGALPQKREIEVASILINTGENVRFIVAGLIPTPDITYRNRQWEIKSPIGKSSRTIENNLRNALRQSPNVILDLRYTETSDEKCLAYLTNHIQNFHGLKDLLIISKTNHILNFNPKTSCITELPMLK